MHAPGHLPPYPPERDRWTYPPPPVGRRWLLAAVAAVLGSLGVAVGAVALVAEMDRRDAAGLIDGSSSATVVRRQCALMTSTVQGLRAVGPAEVRVAALADQNKAVAAMLRTIRELPPEVRADDRPLDPWLADWQRLLDAREEWVASVDRGFTGRFVVPETGDGDPITTRMEAAALDVCEVPKVLLDPDSVDDQDV